MCNGVQDIDIVGLETNLLRQKRPVEPISGVQITNSYILAHLRHNILIT